MKAYSNFRLILAIALLFFLSAEALHPPHKAAATGNIIYVNANNNSGTYNGSSWITAYRKLQNALDNASASDQIWVAEAVYYPDEGNTQTDNDRNSTFTLKNDLALYGGFSGTETLLSQRDVAANPTILSGDIDKDDTNTDGNFIAEQPSDIQGNNAYHVVSGGGTSATAILDGFIITAGKATFNTSPAEPCSLGGGMYNSNSSPSLSNLTFTGNFAYQGGGMYNNSSSPALANVSFDTNHALDGGGAMYNKSSSPTLTNVTFEDNLAYGDGGGMLNLTGSNPTLTNVTFTRNTVDHPLYTDGDGAGMYNIQSDPVLTDVTFTDNSADAYGGGMSNNQSNPSLTNVSFIGNSAPIGGGMYNNSSDYVLTNVAFTGNLSDQGGGTNDVSSNPLLTNVTFKNNFSTTDGGGMYLQIYSSPTLTNVTFGGNTAVNYGGGIFTRSYSTPALINVTINANGASYYGGLYIVDNSTVLLKNSLIANNAVYECYTDGTSSLNSASSNNLIEDSATACGLTNGVNGNIVGLDPLVSALQNHGGFSETFALQMSSPAIDTGTNSGCPATDQRGVTRPKDGNSDSDVICDIGAYEINPYRLFMPLVTR